AAERGDDRDGGMEAGHDVDERNARLRWRPVGLAGDRHQPALRLHDEVVSRALGGPVPAEAGDRAVDDGRVALVDRRRAQTEPLSGAWPEVLEHDVGTRAEVEHE